MDVSRRAKRRATDEGRLLSDLIHDALERYLISALPKWAHREAAFQLFCERPIQLSPDQFKAMLEYDTWGARKQ